MNIWLDDLRPAPDDWVWCKSIAEVKTVLLSDAVIVNMSLDHDLGACEKCMRGLTPEQWLAATNFTQMPNCTHTGTGYDLVAWMEINNKWPVKKPYVHSANPAGAARMRQIIDRAYDAK